MIVKKGDLSKSIKIYSNEERPWQTLKLEAQRIIDGAKENLVIWTEILKLAEEKLNGLTTR